MVSFPNVDSCKSTFQSGWSSDVSAGGFPQVTFQLYFGSHYIRKIKICGDDEGTKFINILSDKNKNFETVLIGSQICEEEKIVYNTFSSIYVINQNRTGSLNFHGFLLMNKEDKIYIKNPSINSMFSFYTMEEQIYDITFIDTLGFAYPQVSLGVPDFSKPCKALLLDGTRSISPTSAFFNYYINPDEFINEGRIQTTQILSSKSKKTFKFSTSLQTIKNTILSEEGLYSLLRGGFKTETNVDVAGGLLGMEYGDEAIGPYFKLGFSDEVMVKRKMVERLRERIYGNSYKLSNSTSTSEKIKGEIQISIPPTGRNYTIDVFQKTIVKSYNVTLTVVGFKHDSSLCSFEIGNEKNPIFTRKQVSILTDKFVIY